MAETITNGVASMNLTENRGVVLLCVILLVTKMDSENDPSTANSTRMGGPQRVPSSNDANKSKKSVTVIYMLRNSLIFILYKIQAMEFKRF